MTEDKIVEFLDKFSAKIAEASGQGFEYVAQYNVTSAWTSLLMFCAALIISTIGLVICLRGLDKYAGTGKDMETVYGIGSVVCELVLFISVVSGLVSMSDWIATIQNPEGSVIQGILRKL